MIKNLVVNVDHTRPRLRLPDLVFFLMSATLFLSWFVWQLPWVKPGRLEQLFIPEYIEHMSMVDVIDRRRAYQAALLSILGFSALGFFIWSQKDALVPQWVWNSVGTLMKFLKRRGAILGGIILAVLYIRTLATQSSLNYPDSSFGLYFVPSRTMYCVFVLISAGLLIVISAIVLHGKQRFVNPVLWLLILVYVLLTMVPGTFEKIPVFNLSWPMILYMEDSHGPSLGDA